MKTSELLNLNNKHNQLITHSRSKEKNLNTFIILKTYHWVKKCIICKSLEYNKLKVYDHLMQTNLAQSGRCV